MPNQYVKISTRKKISFKRLDEADFMIVMCLAFGITSMTDIAAILDINKSKVSERIERMVLNKLVQRNKSPELTQEAVRALQAAFNSFNGFLPA